MKKGFLLIDKKNKMKATSTSHTDGGKSHTDDDKSHTDVGNDGKSHKDDGNDDGPCHVIPAGQRFSGIEALIRSLG